MSEKVKQDDNLQLNQRIDEFNDMKLLFNTFGEVAYRATQKYFFYHGYEIGYEKVLKAVKNGELTPPIFQSNPVEIIKQFLIGFFKERGGNQPDIWIEKSVIYLRTKKEVWCPAPPAVEKSGVQHKDICNIHKRSLVMGLVIVFEEFFPGLVINGYGDSSRFDDEKSDCVEAYQIIYYM